MKKFINTNFNIFKSKTVKGIAIALYKERIEWGFIAILTLLICYWIHKDIYMLPYNVIGIILGMIIMGYIDYKKGV